jgi:hypothetical protein
MWNPRSLGLGPKLVSKRSKILYTEIRKFVTTFADDSKTMAQLVFMKTSVLVEVWQIHGQEDIKLCPGE